MYEKQKAENLSIVFYRAEIAFVIINRTGGRIVASKHQKKDQSILDNNLCYKTSEIFYSSKGRI